MKFTSVTMGAAAVAIALAAAHGTAGAQTFRTNDLPARGEAPAEIERTPITIFEPVHFEQGSAEILQGSLPTLDQIARQVKDGEGGVARVRVRGHAFEDGAEDADKLSEARARRIEAYLVAAGVPADKVSAEWVGAAEPVTGVDETLVPALSRRVEFLPVLATDLALP